MEKGFTKKNIYDNIIGRREDDATSMRGSAW